MKKIINVITLIVMVCVNTISPFTYAISIWDDFLETENIETTSQETETFEDEENDEIDIYSNEDLQTEEDFQSSSSNCASISVILCRRHSSAFMRSLNRLFLSCWLMLEEFCRSLSIWFIVLRSWVQVISSYFIFVISFSFLFVIKVYYKPDDLSSIFFISLGNDY